MEQSIGIVGFDDPTFDPFATSDMGHGWETVSDPYPAIARLRTEASVHQGGFREAFGAPADATLAHLPHFTLYGYDEISEALLDSSRFSNTIYEHNIGKGFGRSITAMDAPEHTQYRRLFQKAFLPKQITEWGDRDVVPVVQALIDKFADRGEAELVSEFTTSFPFHFIYRQLALPADDVEIFHALAVGLMCVTTDAVHGVEANRKLGDYFERLLEHRRSQPGDDLVSQLVLAQIDGERLPNDVIIAFLRQLLNAGGDTTFRATGSTLAGLLADKDQLAAIRADRQLMPQAVAEGLRWEPPTTQLSRSPLRDVEMGGLHIPAGAALDIVVASANRDPAQFENPNQFDLFRAQKRNMTFGYGAHLCIGQFIARLETQVAINALLDRLPKLRLNDQMPAPQIAGLTKRSPDRIHVRFD